MANDDAWDAGWAAGSGKKKKTRKPRRNDSGEAANAGKGAANPYSILSYLPHLHKGGKVRKTGPYVLQKGETVVARKSSRRKDSLRKRVAAKR